MSTHLPTLSASEGPPITAVKSWAYRIPTSAKESDGTLEWDHTTLVLVEIAAGSWRGIGYTYASEAAVSVVTQVLAPRLWAAKAGDAPRLWATLIGAVRNLGPGGLAWMAVSAVDAALWDLRGKLAGCSTAALIGAARPGVPGYGSGGFTSYTDGELASHCAAWIERGVPRMKIKVGRQPERDPARVAVARQAIGADAELYVDANGAYSVKQALKLAEAFAAQGVRWLEEPRPSEDLLGLHRIRSAAPAGMEVAAGEYGYGPAYFERMLAAGAVDVVQIDATRCGGLSGFLASAAVAAGHQIPVSSHCAPALHATLGVVCPQVRHAELFEDHVALESSYFDGALTLKDGLAIVDLARPGLGLVPKFADLAPFQVSAGAAEAR